MHWDAWWDRWPCSHQSRTPVPGRIDRSVHCCISPRALQVNAQAGRPLAGQAAPAARLRAVGRADDLRRQAHKASAGHVGGGQLPHHHPKRVHVDPIRAAHGQQQLGGGPAGAGCRRRQSARQAPPAVPCRPPPAAARRSGQQQLTAGDLPGKRALEVGACGQPAGGGHGGAAHVTDLGTALQRQQDVGRLEVPACMEINGTR